MKIFISYAFRVSECWCENAFPESSIHSIFRCSFWQRISFWPHSTIWVVYKYIDTCNTLFKDIYFTLNLQIPQAANVGG